MSKTIFITGASSGIGRATAELFAEKGWNVVATMRRPEKGQDLAAHDGIDVLRLDVTDEASIRQSVAETIEKFGRIDVLLNNAGYGSIGVAEFADIQETRRLYETLVIGLIEVTKAVLPNMRANRSGVVINVSSVGGRITFPLMSLYHGTKWAVEGFSEALSFELAPLGIQVKILEPGAISTGRTTICTLSELMVEVLYCPDCNIPLIEPSCYGQPTLRRTHRRNRNLAHRAARPARRLRI